jgi:PTH1 family peptidyl-tRNA hydrolase
MRIIIGLGNPGEKYKNTRHNAGFMAVDALAEKLNLSWQFNKKFNAEIAIQKAPLIRGDGGVILVKPLTFMNNSGQAVQAVLSYYKLLPKKLGIIKLKDSNLSDILTVIHDDIDIEFGKYKISIDSRAGGHNGVQSIIDYLKTKNFKRIRIGVKTEMLNKIPADKFVLQNFNGEEMDIVNKLIGEIITTVIPDTPK